MRSTFYIAKIKQGRLYRRAVDLSFPLRRRLSPFVPDSVAAKARKALGLKPLRTIDLGRLALIRAASVSQLRDPNFLEHELLPRLGLNGDAPQVYPAELRSHVGGLWVWQYPNQFSRYLVRLSFMDIRSYLEIGVQYGGTFAVTLEYLRRFSPSVRGYAVDLNRVPSLKAYARTTTGAQVLRLDSRTMAFGEFVGNHGPFDLILIDGDHSEEGCRHDFETVRLYGRIIAFHDIVDGTWPGVKAVWNQVQAAESERYRFEEFVDQYTVVKAAIGHDLLGIGLAIRK